MSPVRCLLTTAIVAALAACSPAPQDHLAAPAAASVAKPAAPAAAAAPVIGIDLAGIDHSVKPGDNFFDYANGAWYKQATIPADRSSIGTFFTVFKKAEQRSADLIKAAGDSHPAAGTDQRRIADYYAAWMDTAAIEKAGLAPLQPALDAIHAIKTRADLARVLGSRLRADVDPINATHFHTQNLFGLFVTKGLETNTNIAYLLQGGLGMPSRDYYLSDDKAMVAARDAYQTYMTALLTQAGVANAAAQAKAAFALETKIASAQESLLDSQDVHQANNLWARTDFAHKAPGLDWNAYFDAAGLGTLKSLDVWQPVGISGLAKLVGSEPITAWQALLTFHTLNASANLLPKAYADLQFGFYGKTLSGTPEQQERWKRAVAATGDDLGDAVGKIYVEKYFPTTSKARIEQLVKNLIKAFDANIDALGWMTAATKAKAHAKIATLRVSVGYPDNWRDYSTLDIKPDDALGNHLRAVAFEYAHQKAKIGTPIDKGEWWMTPQTVNAVNLPLQNALNFPAAILEPPFFDPAADDAANYGSIGAIIGHEISHSFDNLGAEFDAQGDLANWWTPEDAAHFKAAGERLAQQFDHYEALPDLHVNGELTLGENIADVSGLTVALAAYHASLGGQPAPVIDGLTGDQRFFLAFGQAWRGKIRDAALRQRLATDVHAPGNF
ncbi:MAG TPA: M13 family metallopeptidase, partial [Rhodanobacteraceae bacterium]|nr:M13 family metallopeptidase [Rhodanobacteraceae bacterium]